MTISKRKLNFWELGAAGALLLLGLYLLVQGSGYPIGTMVRIGPGFFPVIAGVALIVLSGFTMLEVRHSAAPPPALPLRPLGCIALALVLFGLLIDRIGLVPATFILVFVSAAAETSVNWVRTALLSVILAFASWLIFIVAFRLPLLPFWW